MLLYYPGLYICFIQVTALTSWLEEKGHILSDMIAVTALAGFLSEPYSLAFKDHKYQTK